ncbi:hypothetical protein [Streptomyces sp. MI02-7b]|uniref:hypothetical protein n=1 Tax=Streptomyces sp. MI02-7b TaxID=462941 RepID=UPI0029ADF95C|nr:hypothetical protein [Streptomyces sp. MI02-7b]MDX3074605.1 hypothetical protein [Streptomyces sp. MI02-7b]
MEALALTTCLLLMLGAALGILAVDRRALSPVLVTAAFVITLGALVAGLFSL